MREEKDNLENTISLLIDNLGDICKEKAVMEKNVRNGDSTLSNLLASVASMESVLPMAKKADVVMQEQREFVLSSISKMDKREVDNFLHDLSIGMFADDADELIARANQNTFTDDEIRVLFKALKGVQQ